MSLLVLRLTQKGGRRDGTRPGIQVGKERKEMKNEKNHCRFQFSQIHLFVSRSGWTPTNCYSCIFPGLSPYPHRGLLWVSGQTSTIAHFPCRSEGVLPPDPLCPRTQRLERGKKSTKYRERARAPRDLAGREHMVSCSEIVPFRSGYRPRRSFYPTISFLVVWSVYRLCQETTVCWRTGSKCLCLNYMEGAKKRKKCLSTSYVHGAFFNTGSGRAKKNRVWKNLVVQVSFVRLSKLCPRLTRTRQIIPW